MAAHVLHHDERTGLVLATLLHAAVLAALLLGRRDAAPVPEPERVAVTISEDSAPTSTAPQPAAQPAPDVAPQLGEPAPPAPAEAQSQPQPQPQPAPSPPAPAPPVRQPEPRPRPIACAQPQPRPAVKAPSPPPVPTPPARPSRVAPAPPRTAPPRTATAPATPSRTPATRAAASPGRAPATTAPPRQAGGSRIGADFLKGVANAPATAARGQPAAAIGTAERSSLSSSIARQIKPNWTAPQGADAELLVTVLAWELDAQGRLTGKPRVVSQQGITDGNRAQSARHAEQAIRAVQLAAPFQLPAQYYAAWRRVQFKFDRKLSQ